MVYSSVPLYLDPPNWQQQQQQHPNEISPQVLPPPLVMAGGGPTGAPPSTRPSSSMADRARQAKIPAPEGPLNCPRCDSSNTKFCYFNNYSLSQPRHFCKACRRYWTRGGSLRSVPVGGGCRRNKRKKSGRDPPKSPSKAGQTTPQITGNVSEFGSGGHHMLPAVGPMGPAPAPPFSFLESLQSLTQMGNLGLNFGALGHNLGNYGDGDELGQQPQQLSNLLAGLGSSSSSSMYPFQNVQGMETASFGKGMGMQQQRQQQSVKMEGMGQQFWTSGSSINGTGGGMWTDLSGICSTSTATHNILR